MHVRILEYETPGDWVPGWIGYKTHLVSLAAPKVVLYTHAPYQMERRRLFSELDTVEAAMRTQASAMYTGPWPRW